MQDAYGNYVPNIHSADITPPPVSGGGGGGGGGSSTNSPVVYTADPNTESLAPSNNLLPAMAYSASGNGAIFGWSVTFQRWV